MGLRILGSPPSTQELADALMVAAEALEKDKIYAFDGRFHFVIDPVWTIALSADSVDRVRVETCRLSCPTETMWVLAERHDRIAALVLRMHSEVLELV